MLALAAPQLTLAARQLTTRTPVDISRTPVDTSRTSVDTSRTSVDTSRTQVDTSHTLIASVRPPKNSSESFSRWQRKMIGNIEDLKEMCNTTDTCYQRPEKYVDALRPDVEFRK